MTSGLKRDYLTIILGVVILAMGIEIIYLVKQNRKLAAMLANPGQAFQTLARSDTVPSLSATDVSGRAVEIRYALDAPHTVLFWFSPSCNSCEENLEFWKEIYTSFQSDHVRFIALCDASAEEARTFAQQHQLAFPIVCVHDDRLIEAYKGRVLPQTVLIAPAGEIVDSWPGVLSEHYERLIRDVLLKL